MRKIANCFIIIPAYNEAENIEKVVNHIAENYPQYDYVVVSDGSRDDTEEICMRNHYDIAVQIDGVGQHDITYVEKLIDPIINGEADVTIGSKYINKEGFQSSKSRRQEPNFSVC